MPRRDENRLVRKFAADFETTTKIDDCRVWAWCAEDLDDEDYVMYGTDIDSFLEAMAERRAQVYFHNLAFDGSFILDALFRLGFEYVDKNPKPGQFTSIIDNAAKFFSIKVKWWNSQYTDFRDSLKKLPMSIAKIAETFHLDVTKGEIDYHAERPVGYSPTPEEWDYIGRDVHILAKAMRQVLSTGLTKMTVGADALAEFQSLMGGKESFRAMFPTLSHVADADIRAAYRGGFTYADDRFKNRIVGPGSTYDVNSLYPYIMRTRLLPYGMPVWFDGEPKVDPDFPLYVMSVTFTAEIKPDHIPVIQIRSSSFFLETKYQTEIDDPVTLFVTNVDWELWNQQYDIDVICYNGGYKLRAAHGLFNKYIDKWMKVKENSVGGAKALAKLQLNSLYGKFATNPDVTGKHPVMEDNIVKLKVSAPEERDPVYVPMGVFITSYARMYTISACQANYENFCYADTDSLHILGNDPVGISIDPSHLGDWKEEYQWSEAVFTRAKCYTEVKMSGEFETHIAGLPKHLADTVTLDHHLNGHTYSGKLTPVRVPGGVVLLPSEFKLDPR